MAKAKPKRKPRKLLLKFRIMPKVRMPRSVAWQKVMDFVATGEMPHDLDISFMDYDHQVGKQFFAGDQVSPEDFDEFKNLLAIMAGAKEQEPIRLERIGK